MHVKRTVQIFCLIVCVCLASASGTGCGRIASEAEAAQPALTAYAEQQFLLDTSIAITVYATSQQQAQAALDAAFAAFSRIELLATRFAADADNGERAAVSEVCRINASAGEQPVAVGQEIALLLQKSQEYYTLSGGVFRAAIGPLMDLWGIGTDHARVPDDAELAAVLPFIYQENVVYDPQAGTVYLLEAGMSLDFGGIAKGYATDLAAEALRDQGIQHALLDAGGNVYAVGSKPDGNPWRIGIRDPRRDGEILGVVEVADQAVVTSGDYERYFVVDGIRYHHILDPRDGKPARAAQQTTVVAPSSLEADALSTITFILSQEQSAAILQERALAGVRVADDGEISVVLDGVTPIWLN
ncbi:MAG: FAD:protein FMN transferase [Peptococcaceae bacterium]|jgi:thiamine biosynthesis lipoprotein|nr:FAD:protein FMN transferase [Peptococcaceae bacterium]